MLGLKLIFATCFTSLAQAAHVVDLGYSVYEGYYNHSLRQNVWQGIRYAAPPLGDNRWRTPQAPELDRDHTILADALPQRCPQGPQAPLTPEFNFTGTEDCLFLSVYSPVNSTGLPVFFWVHGGGYGGGRGSQDIGLISDVNNNSFVSVVIQYRLGAFGFLASDEVHRFGNVNAGLLDQHYALEWVQKHISKFGGDPRKVTLAGESAGGGSVMLQAMARGGTLGTTLFENVIAASPYLPMQYSYHDWQSSQAYYAFAAAVGCFPQRAYGNTSTTILDCLRHAPTELLQNASAVVGASGTWGTWAFLPVTDGDFVKQRPTEQLLSGRVNGRRVMSGNNAMEGAAFVIPNITTDTDFEDWLRLEYPLLTPHDIDEILNTYYPAINDPGPPFATCGDCGGTTAINVGSVATGPFQRAINLYSETTFVCPSYWLAQAFSGAGQEAYKYQYSIPAGQHAADLNAEGLRPPGPNIGPDFARTFTSMWGNMVTQMSPAVPGIEWPMFTADGLSPWQMLNLNQTGGTEYSAHVVAYPVANATQYEGPGLQNNITIVDGYAWEGGRGARCEFWAKISQRVPE